MSDFGNDDHRPLADMVVSHVRQRTTCGLPGARTIRPSGPLSNSINRAMINKDLRTAFDGDGAHQDRASPLPMHRRILVWHRQHPLDQIGDGLGIFGPVPPRIGRTRPVASLQGTGRAGVAFGGAVSGIPGGGYQVSSLAIPSLASPKPQQLLPALIVRRYTAPKNRVHTPFVVDRSAVRVLSPCRRVAGPVGADRLVIHCASSNAIAGRSSEAVEVTAARRVSRELERNWQRSDQ